MIAESPTVPLTFHMSRISLLSSHHVNDQIQQDWIRTYQNIFHHIPREMLSYPSCFGCFDPQKNGKTTSSTPGKKKYGAPEDQFPKSGLRLEQHVEGITSNSMVISDIIKLYGYLSCLIITYIIYIYNIIYI